MSLYEDASWLLEQWGLWSRGENCLPKALGAGSEQPEKWVISDELAIEVDRKIRVLPACHCSTLKRYHLSGDYDVAADIMDAAIECFALVWRGEPASRQVDEIDNVVPIRQTKTRVCVRDRSIAEAKRQARLFRRFRQNRPIISLHSTTG